MTSLNETQSTAVCLTFCAAGSMQDAADALGVRAFIFIDTKGDLFAAPDGNTRIDYPHFLRNVKDRTPKEIEDYKNAWIAALRKGVKESKADRIEALKQELAALCGTDTE